jgi:hypothetical protein
MSQAIIQHKPGLKYPYQVRVIGPKGKLMFLTAKKTEREAQIVVDRLRKSAAAAEGASA